MKRFPFLNLVLIVMGSCIGAGIFMTPKKAATIIPYPGLLIPIWILGGIIALSGAFTYSELAARYPKAGGVYAYLREAYGNVVAFMFGWVVLMAVTSGAIAGLSLGFADFFEVFLPMDDAEKQAMAVLVICICTGINIQGLNVGRSIAGFITALKVIGIIGLIVAGLAIFQMPVAVDWTIPPMSWKLVGTVLLAMVNVYWAYGGWHHLTYLSAEVPDAPRKLGLAMLLGVLGVTAAYVAVNLAYLRVLPITAITTSEGQVAADMMKAVFGAIGGKILAALVCLSIFGSILIFTMSAPRIYFAMAADGVFFKGLARLHPKTGTPALAIGLQSAWAIVLLFVWGTFSDLVDYVTYTEAVFLVMAAFAVYIFRWRDKRNGIVFKGYRVPGYPFTPLIYAVITGAFVTMGLIDKAKLSWAAGILLVVGLGMYYWFRRSGKEVPGSKG